MSAVQLELFPEFHQLPSPAVEASMVQSAVQAAALWARLLPELTALYGAAICQNWLAPLRPTGLAGDTFILAAPTRLIQEWCQTRYADDILRLSRTAAPNLRFIDLQFDPDAHIALSLDAPELMLTQAPSPVMDFAAPLDGRFTFANFVLDKSNQLAFEAARRVAQDDHVEFNPLFLHGGVGLGKTHLLHAIAHEMRARQPQRRVVYLSAEQFMYQFIRALRDKSTMSFKELFRAVDVLMIDDVQFISGKESTQEEFFHTFNALIEQGKQIILSADKSPGDLAGVGARLTSRMAMGLVADIHPTSYELRLGVLHAKAENRKVAVPAEVLGWLAQNITSNIRELDGAFNRLVAHAELTRTVITLDYARQVLADQMRQQARRLTLEDIQKQVAQYYDLRMADLLSTRRARAVARPRQLAMYLAKYLTTKSLPDIGRAFGGRDHTTVMHAVRTIENLLLTDPALADAAAALRRQLAA